MKNQKVKQKQKLINWNKFLKLNSILSLRRDKLKNKKKIWDEQRGQEEK